MSGSGGVFADGTRLRILTDLVRDLLGPRDGPEELVRRDDPCALYLTAVLAPRPEQGDVPRSRDPEAEQAIPVNEVEFLSAEDDTDDAGEPGAFVAPPELDPAARPCGMGITFEVETDSRVSLDLCVTWARYLPEDDRQKPREWRRHPRVWVGDVTVGIGEARVVCLGPNGALPEQHPDCELSLHIRTRWVPGERRTRATVTLYLINRLQRRSSRTDPADHIFQPQLRVLSHPEPSPMRTPMTGGADREALVLELLHRHRAIRARGHMCSAVWREVDPERDPGTDAPPEQLEHLRALTWPDGAVLAREIRERFTAPHVRSEFIPVYAVLTSDAGWPEDLPSTPELRADVLAECWEPEELRRALEPLVRLFEQRVAEWKQEADRIALESRGYHAAVWHLFNQAGDAARRMRAGLELLLSDREARLAFCFSCRAVSLQHHWAGGEMAGPFRWRPFQLAFILSVLESIVRPDSYDRDALDLLWVPTGLGKTEAYLALMAFAIAYRRRRALRRRVGNGAGTAVISRYTLRLLTIQQFRRALRMITACEYLRVLGLRGGGPVGWRPARCNIRDQFIWGTARFAIGLWVGGNVTPNHLGSGPPSNPGAMYALKKPSGGGAHRGEPAQVLECPACGGVLAFDTLPQGVHTLSWLVEARSPQRILQAARRSPGHPAFEVLDVSLTRLADSTAAALEVRLSCGRDVLADEIHDWLETVLKGSGVQLTAHAGRPGYFIRRITGPKGGAHEIDFDIFCPRPRCPLNDGVLWAEGVPCDASAGPGADTGATQVYQLVLPRGQAVTSPDGLAFRTAPAFVRPGSGSHRTYLSVSV
ncbi:MAG: hypothetical protein QN144_14945, partial [Armatimonadota bacterium]|nr:hypothetical protein [Armatimonadota bacterium]